MFLCHLYINLVDIIIADGDFRIFVLYGNLRVFRKQKCKNILGQVVKIEDCLSSPTQLVKK